MNHKPQVLFFSVGDSTRSQIAEGFLRRFAGHEFIQFQLPASHNESEGRFPQTAWPC